MPLATDQEILDWYIKREEKNKDQPWWPKFLKILKEEPQKIADVIQQSRMQDTGMICFLLGKTVLVDPVSEWGNKIVKGLREHFLGKAS